MAVVFVVFFLLFPALVIYLCRTFSFLDKIGAVVICYIVGALIGNAGILPAGFDKVQNPLMLVNICLALPLMFFSLDIKRWTRLAGKSILSFALQTLSIVIIATAGFFMFRSYVGPETWKIAGMFIGVYTGGTINLGAIATALQTDRTLYLAAHTSDVVVSSVYLLFLMTIGQKLFLKMLPPFKPAAESGPEETFNFNSYEGIFRKEISVPLLGAFGLSLLIFVVGCLAFLVLSEDTAFVVAILVIATLGIAFSFVPGIRNIKMTYQLGNYFILVFSLVVSSMANINRLIATAPVMLVYVTFTLFMCLLLHVMFSSFLKIDADTVIITSVAGICSPPLVPMVASALKNREIVITGVVTGIIGWVIGTYLGIGVAYLLHNLPV
ncbi:MAG TPA: DUF819 family protein [Spirochaetota bacterium]|nr:DUF819 family protein [Spirochaetota bacterium]HPC41439.1 DUF819 family protein [Spirochaetota bacterium]HPL18121.1 DUF819 family protein [Spirochaetota bacterium]HQF09178.1 DUF819 family protein [Spirochaetota bacterium]HQH97720.1 DUF819 family protein [Spirochaetota bacterium]